MVRLAKIQVVLERQDWKQGALTVDIGSSTNRKHSTCDMPSGERCNIVQGK